MNEELMDALVEIGRKYDQWAAGIETIKRRIAYLKGRIDGIDEGDPYTFEVKLEMCEECLQILEDSD